MQNKPKSAKRNSKTIPAPQPKLKGEVLLARDRVKPHLASPFTVRMDSRTIRRLNRAAKTRTASVPDLIRTAVATFLEMVFDGEETFGISNYQLRRA